MPPRRGGMECLRLCRRRSLISWGELPSLGRESLVFSLICAGIPIQGKVPRYRRKSFHGVVVESRTSIALLLSTCLDLKSTCVDIRVYARG